jgi:peptide deformylase
MIKEITTYPQTPSLEFGANVRFYNEELFELIQDLKDTIEANDLNALAAFQIGSPLCVIVVKQGDSYLELINPKVLKREGSVEATETTAYFPGLSAKTTRYDKIKLMYEDRDGKQQFLEADGELSIIIQRKIDYTYGSNFRVRLSKEEKELFDAKLEFGTDAITKNDCPTVFKRDVILKTFKFLLVVGVLALIGSFFVGEETLDSLAKLQTYLLEVMAFLVLVYFFYAQYEGKQYKHCTSCQIGNIIGTTILLLIKLSILAVATYFIL